MKPESQFSHLQPLTIASARATASRFVGRIMNRVLNNHRGPSSLVKKFYEDRFRFGSRPFDFALAGRKNLVGAEVGVLWGDHAHAMLSRLDIERIYLVDLYQPYADFDAETMDFARRSAKQRLRHFHNCAFVYADSRESAGLVPLLDFAYLDGAHDAASVRRDIAAWWPAIKPGGILGGHDFGNALTVHSNGVIRASTEFAFSRNLELNVQLPDWWIVKR